MWRVVSIRDLCKHTRPELFCKAAGVVLPTLILTAVAAYVMFLFAWTALTADNVRLHGNTCHGAHTVEADEWSQGWHYS